MRLTDGGGFHDKESTILDLDNTDLGILTLLGKNARSRARQISTDLKELGIFISDRAVLQRITKLQRRGYIDGYTTILGPTIPAIKTWRTLFLQISPKADAVQNAELKAYFSGSPFCTSAEWLKDMGYLCHWVFDTERQFNLQFDVFLRKFKEMISDYVVFESETIKESLYRVTYDQSQQNRRFKALLSTIRLKESKDIEKKLLQFANDISSCFDAKIVSLWRRNKKTNEIELTCGSGKYSERPPEYTEISGRLIKITSMLETKKPVLTNDVLHDFSISNGDWLVRESVISYVGYPLIHEDRVLGILEMYSEWHFSPADFEIAQLLSEEVSRVLGSVAI